MKFFPFPTQICLFIRVDSRFHCIFQMKVFLSVASFQSAYGGPARSVSGLAVALAQAGIDVGVWAPDQSAADTRFLGRDSCVQRLLGSAGEALAQFGKPDVIHDNGIWLPHNHALAKLAQTRDIPRVVSTRGMLEPWALNHKRWKKRLAWWLYQGHDLRSATCHHVTSEAERKTVARFDWRRPVHVTPNGVDIPSAVESRAPRKSPRTVLFVGRIYPVKGLPLLVEAWAKVRPPGWKMQIVGPDEAGHRAAVETLVQHHGLAATFEFTGELDGDAKRQAYESADLFVLPSHTENFGMAIGEALAHGLPVITTEGTPWQALGSERCGWWTPVSVAGIAHALTEATACPPQELQTMGARGRLWMQRDFSWASVAAAMRRMYEAVGAG